MNCRLFKLFSVTLSICLNVSLFASECHYSVLAPSPVEAHYGGHEVWQLVQFNRDLHNSSCLPLNSTRGQIYFTRNVKGSCEVRLQNVLSSHSVTLWIRINAEEEKLAMNSRYSYGAEYVAQWECPSHDLLDVQFAFDLGNGQWFNNLGNDFRVIIPSFR